MDKQFIRLSITRLPSRGFGVRKQIKPRIPSRTHPDRVRKSNIPWREGKVEMFTEPLEAVDFLKSEAVELRRAGHTVQVMGNVTTQSLVKRYSRSHEIGSLGNTTLFIMSDTSTGFPYGVVEVPKLK